MFLKRKTQSKNIKEFLPYQQLYRLRYVLFISLIALLAGTFQFVRNYNPGINVKGFLYYTEQTAQDKHRFEEVFGNPNYDMFILEGADFTNAEALNALHQLDSEVKSKVPYLEETFSILSLLPKTTKFPIDEKTAEWLRKQLQNNPRMRQQFLSDDQLQTLLVMSFHKNLDDIDDMETQAGHEPIYVQIGNVLKDVAERFQENTRINSSKIQVTNTGINSLINEQYQFFLGDLRVTFAILVVLILLLISLSIRNFYAALATAFNCFFSNWLVIGIMGYFNYNIDLSYLMIPLTLSMATAIGYSVHMYNHVLLSLSSHKSIPMAISFAYLRCFKPLTYTALTTTLSLSSLLFIPIPNIQIAGLSCIAVVLIIWIFTLLYFPLILGMNKKVPYLNLQQFSTTFLVKISRKLFPYYKPIRIVTIFVLIASFLLCFRMTINYDIQNHIGKKNQVVKNLVYLQNTNLASLGSVSIMIQGPKEMFADPAQFEKLTEIDQQLSSEAMVQRTSSINDILQTASRLRGSTQLPKTRAQLNGLLLTAERFTSFDPYLWISKDFSSVHISVELNSFESAPIVELQRKYEKIIKEFYPEADVIFTSFMLHSSQSEELMTRSFLRSIIISLVIVFFIMFMLFNNLKLTIISMIPNLLPLLIAGAATVILKIQLNGMIMLIFPMMLGLIVDDTIHFFYHIKKQFRFSYNFEIAVLQSIHHVGGALIQTSIILAGSFVALAFSHFQTLSYLGFLAISITLLGFLTNTFLAPCFLHGMFPEEPSKKTVALPR